MAYPAIVSLSQTIDQILNSGQHSTISAEVKQHVIALQKLVLSFQDSLETFPESAKSLEDRIREVGNEAEDTIEYLMLEYVFECNPSNNYEDQLKTVTKEMELLAREVMEIKDSFRRKSLQPVAGSSDLSSSGAAPFHRDEVVGFEDDVLAIKERLCGGASKLQVIPICGMGGIGKTTLAKNVYEDPLIVYHFDVRVWVTISQDYSAERILSSLLDSMKELNLVSSGTTNDEKVHKILMGRRYLVVMDDVWSSESWDLLRNAFPDVDNRSRIMITTRLSDVASYPDPSSDCHEMSLMDEDRSWDLFKKKIFTDEDYPSELESIGKEISRSCKGLPLAIVVIGGVLSTVSNDRASWREIADKIKFSDSAEKGQIEEILSLSYTHLPQYLRPCFLYMGLFPEDHEIRASKLTKLWVAEGFLKHPKAFKTLENEAEACLEDLIKRSLVLVAKRKWDGRIKSCRLHDLMRDLCIRKAYESKFFLNLMDKNVEKEHFIESTKNQCRIHVDSSSLEHLSNTHGLTIRSILCSNTNDRVVLVLNFLRSVRLLRVLDAEPADMDSLPSQLFDLFHLRYLAFRFDHEVPRSMSKLQNLQTLIIRLEKRVNISVGVPIVRHMNEIWKMPQLRHLYSDIIVVLNDDEGSILENLQTISSICFSSCTESIFKMIPNLKKLGIRCSRHDLPYDGKAFLNNLVHLHRLENLEIYGGIYGPTYYSLTLPTMLRKLTLNFTKLNWDEMNIIVGSLPNLQVLKMEDHNIWPSTGVVETWETIEGGFPKLEIFLLKGSNLRYWITESDHFPSLRCLMLSHCRLLHEIPESIGEIPTLELIEVKGERKKSLDDSATKILEEQQTSYGNYAFQVQISPDHRPCSSSAIPLPRFSWGGYHRHRHQHRHGDRYL